MTKRNYEANEKLWLDRFSPKNLDDLPDKYKNFFIEAGVPINRKNVDLLCISEMYMMNLEKKYKGKDK